MQKKLMSMLVMAAIFSLGTSVMAQDGGNAGDGKRKAARTAAKDKGDAQKDKALAAGDVAKDKRGDVVDKRQDNQAKRIQHGIDKGYLTPEETKSLQDQQQKIAS